MAGDKFPAFLKIMKNQSHYDPSRKTVGAIYRDAQFNGEKQVITGDMNYELRKSLCEDVNDTIVQGTKDFEGRPFYITVHEKRDLQMKNAFLRRMIKTVYRPYPEDDTLVFHVIPYSNQVLFCWELPHWSNMDNILANRNLYDWKIIEPILAWKSLNLEFFGFMKDENGNWTANPRYCDKQMSQEEEKQKIHIPIGLSIA